MIAALWRTRTRFALNARAFGVSIERCQAWFDSDLGFEDFEVARDAILAHEHTKAFEILGAFYSRPIFGQIVEMVMGWPLRAMLISKGADTSHVVRRYMYRFSGDQPNAGGITTANAVHLLAQTSFIRPEYDQSQLIANGHIEIELGAEGGEGSRSDDPVSVETVGDLERTDGR